MLELYILIVCILLLLLLVSYKSTEPFDNITPKKTDYVLTACPAGSTSFNNKEGDTEGSDQYKWWNSETQSNWWDGYIRNVILLNDKAGLKKVEQYVQKVLKSQDEDGYIGYIHPNGDFVSRKEYKIK